MANLSSDELCNTLYFSVRFSFKFHIERNSSLLPNSFPNLLQDISSLLQLAILGRFEVNAGINTFLCVLTQTNRVILASTEEQIILRHQIRHFIQTLTPIW